MENHVIYDELVNRCSTIGGGVNNVQSDLTTLQNDVTTIKNNTMTANQSVVRTGQKGTANQSVSIIYDENYQYNSYSVDIPITAIANASKCWLSHNITVTGQSTGFPGSGGATYIRIRNISVNLYSTYIRVSFEALNTSDRTLNASVYGDWQFIEFY